MTGYLLDTNVLSEFERTRPDGKVIQWMRSSDEETFFVSVLTLGEIRRGILRLQDQHRKMRLERWREDLVLRFQDRVLPIDAPVADLWGQITAGLASKPLPVVDALLAATAIHYGLTLVTRNTCDVERTGVSVLNPWI